MRSLKKIKPWIIQVCSPSNATINLTEFSGPSRICYSLGNAIFKYWSGQITWTHIKLLFLKWVFFSKTHWELQANKTLCLLWGGLVLYFRERGLRHGPPKGVPCKGVQGHSSPVKCLKLTFLEIRFPAFKGQVSEL